MPTPARRIAFEILLRVETQSSYAAELLHSPLTDSLSERDAALCTEIVLGTLRWQRQLDFVAQYFAQGKWERFDPEVRVALRMGLYQLRFLTRVPARAAVHETVEMVKGAGKGSAAGLVNAVLRKGGEMGPSSLRPAEMPDEEWWSIETSHPLWLLERWIQRYGREEALALARANNQPPVTFFRLNPASRSPAEIEEELRRERVRIRPGNFLKSCFAVERENIAKTEVYRRGEVVIQDEASQIVPHLTDVREGQRVLDLCAAPGNKTGLLAQWAGRSGMVVACDIHLHRLRQFVMPPALANVHRVVLDGEQPLPFRPLFDRILVDAPCSGTGTLRRNPELKWRLAPADIAAMAEKQLLLLESASQALVPGGRLVYSTCSLEREENQGVVEHFLQSHPDFRLLPLRDDAARLRPFFHPAADRILTAEFLETSPARDATDGFFAAILVKSDKAN
jgi:16S rRNA (cytosine967-C5)-methyltransferase